MQRNIGRTRLRLIVAIPSIIFLLTMGSTFVTFYLIDAFAPVKVDYAAVTPVVLTWGLAYAAFALLLSYLIVFALTRDLQRFGLVNVIIDDG